MQRGFSFATLSHRLTTSKDLNHEAHEEMRRGELLDDTHQV